MRRLVNGMIAVCYALAVHVLARASVGDVPQNASLETPAPVQRFLANTGPALTSYRAFRTLEAEARGGHTRASLTAWTTLDPVKGFEYSVVEEGGSGIVRQKVLHAALEAERSIRVNGDLDKGALTLTNYAFKAGNATDDGLIRIGIHPKRSDTMLIEGSILLNARDGDLVQVEGALIKRPSFWTREVQVDRRYERICGVRVPVSMHSTARVLIAGRSTFSMIYEYTSINGISVVSGRPAPSESGRRPTALR
jgi:hypothetical protein